MTDSLSTLLKKYNLYPRKGLGQNFLTNPFHVQKIVDAADLDPNDTVLEVGPGPGSLTRWLIDSGATVLAVELDAGMINLLTNEFGHKPNFTLLHADILKTDIDQLFDSLPAVTKPTSFKVVANLPYYITSAVIRHLLETTPKPERLVVTVQKEVAQRIVAQPGKMSILAVSVQLYGQPTLVHHIPATAFYPPPKVDSAVVQVDIYPEQPLGISDTDNFFRVVKAGFSQKRKQLKNSLAGGLNQPMVEIITALEQANIPPTRRAETLSIEEWSCLVKQLPQRAKDGRPRTVDQGR